MRYGDRSVIFCPEIALASHWFMLFQIHPALESAFLRSRPCDARGKSARIPGEAGFLYLNANEDICTVVDHMIECVKIIIFKRC